MSEYVMSPDGREYEFATAYDRVFYEYLAQPLDGDAQRTNGDRLGKITNIETNELVVQGVSRYAQTSRGGATVIAAKVMEAVYGEGDSGAHGLQRLINYVPNPHVLTRRVHSIHAGRKVHYLPSPQRICAAASAFAINALDEIREVSVTISGVLEVRPPEQLHHSVWAGSKQDDICGPWLLDKETAREVQDHLEKYPDIASWTYGALRAAASSLMGDTSRHTQFLVKVVLPLIQQMRQPGGYEEDRRVASDQLASLQAAMEDMATDHVRLAYGQVVRDLQLARVEE